MKRQLITCCFFMGFALLISGCRESRRNNYAFSTPRSNSNKNEKRITDYSIEKLDTFKGQRIITEEYENGVWYTVRKGDTLYGISRKYDINISDLVSRNKIVSSIEVGQKIFVPEPGRVPQSSVFKASSGGIQWPVRGTVKVRFGQLVSGFPSRGIVIGVPNGTEIKAMQDGQVILCTERFPGLGRCLMIKSNKYISVYGQLSRFDVALRDKVYQGQKIGKSGIGLRGKGLYFEVNRGSQAIDPQKLLR